MEAPFNAAKPPQTAAFPLRLHAARMSRSELTALIYDREFSGALTPAEAAHPEGEPGPTPDARWKKMSGFGRWTAY